MCQKRAWEAADSGDRHAIGRGNVGLLQYLPARGRHVARGNRGPVGLIEDVPRAVGTERLDEVGRGERLRKRGIGRRRRNAVRAGARHRRMPVRRAGRGDLEPPPVRVQVKESRCALFFLTTTMRGFAVLCEICSIGSWVPFWMLVDAAATAVPAALSLNRS